jgi:hypothetical protein
MSVERLELSTNGLKGRCSTVELHARDATFYHAPPPASTERVPFIRVFSKSENPDETATDSRPSGGKREILGELVDGFAIHQFPKPRL